MEHKIYRSSLFYFSGVLFYAGRLIQLWKSNYCASKLKLQLIIFSIECTEILQESLHAASSVAPIGPVAHHVGGQSRAFQEPVRKKKNKTNPRELQQRADSIEKGALLSSTREPTRSETHGWGSLMWVEPLLSSFVWSFWAVSGVVAAAED